MTDDAKMTAELREAVEFVRGFSLRNPVFAKGDEKADIAKARDIVARIDAQPPQPEPGRPDTPEAVDGAELAELEVWARCRARLPSYEQFAGLVAEVRAARARPVALDSALAEERRQERVYKLIQEVDHFLHDVTEVDTLKQRAIDLHARIHEEAYQLVTRPVADAGLREAVTKLASSIRESIHNHGTPDRVKLPSGDWLSGESAEVWVETLKQIAALLEAALASPQDQQQTEAPDHTDLMVTPESIDAFLEANPPPTADPEPSAAEVREGSIEHFQSIIDAMEGGI